MPKSDGDNPVTAPAHGWRAYGDAHAELFGPLSPELALVSPDLAKVARALLPERPWEQFARPPALSEPARHPAVVAIPVRPPALPASPAATGLSPPQNPPAPARSRHRRRRPSFGVIAWTAFGVLVLISTLPIVRNGPSLGTASPSAPNLLSGAYISDDFRLVFDGSRSLIITVSASGLCGGEAAINDIPVSEDGRFSAQRDLGGSTVVLMGQFRPPELVTASIGVERPSCASGRRSFTARAS